MNTYPKFEMNIAGEWVGVGSRRTQLVINPATEEVLGELPLADATDLDRALDATDQGYRLWSKKTPLERSDVLRRAANLLRERMDYIARVATTEEGKPVWESRIELNAAINWLEFAAEEGKRAYGRVLVRPTGLRHMVLREPVGPVAAFAPWNFPIGTPMRKLAAALAAGCSCILKAPGVAPSASIELVRAFLDAGLPSGVAQVVFGIPDEVAHHLLGSPIIRKLAFTGSVPVGKHLMKIAAEGMKRTTMELGGHAPVVIFDDADIETALSAMIAYKFRNAGQVCVSPTRFYVQEPIYRDFVRQFAERAKAIPVGNGLDETNRMGPLANPRRREEIEILINDAIKHGAKLDTGGKRIGNQGYYWEPTVLSDVPQEARIMNEEPFGPVAVFQPFKTFEEVVEKANRLPYGLAAYAFTQSSKRSMLISDALEAGMVGVNTNVIAGADAPFGGVKESGHGSVDGPEGVEACQVIKSVSMA